MLGPSLVHLDLGGNAIGPDGTETFARVLGQFPALTHLDLSENQIGDTGTEKVEGVLGQFGDGTPQSPWQSDWRCWDREA